MSVSALRRLIESSGLRHDDCLEKKDLRSRAREAVASLASPSSSSSSSSSLSSSSSSSSSSSVPREFDRNTLIRSSPWLQRVPYLTPDLVPQLPEVVSQLARTYGGDFCWASSFRPAFVAALMAEGFLTMATEAGGRGEGLVALLPKLHRKRCVLRFEDMRVQRGTRKKAKHFTVTANTALDDVVAGLREQHGPECWLYPPLVEALRAIMERPGSFDGRTGNSSSSSSPSSSSSSSAVVVVPVRVHTFEVWDAKTGALAAGEIGCSVGSVYTSMSGFSRQSSAGSVQMAATGALLLAAGCTLWDLGMELKYKMDLGAKTIRRDEFLKAVAAGKRPVVPEGAAGDAADGGLGVASMSSARVLDFREQLDSESRTLAHGIIKKFDPSSSSSSSEGGVGGGMGGGGGDGDSKATTQSDGNGNGNGNGKAV